ncbi:hypothetical protein D3C85_527480 [compost metagenome]
MINWEEKGYESREHYILQMAEDYDVDPEGAISLAEILGDEELFDGFICALQDINTIMGF